MSRQKKTSFFGVSIKEGDKVEFVILGDSSKRKYRDEIETISKKCIEGKEYDLTYDVRITSVNGVEVTN